MAIMAKMKVFTPAPEGMQPSVCVDVVDLGLIDQGYGEKPTVDIKWQIGEIEKESGKPFLVMKRYNNSLHKKATLRKDLETWRGRRFTLEELKGFDLEKLIEKNCQLQIIHSSPTDEGKIYANIETIIPLSKGMEKLTPQDYIRVKDRGDGDTPTPTEKTEPAPADDDDLPF